MQNMPIGIFRGDDTDAFSYQTIVGTINTDLDLTGCKAVFRYLGFSMEFDPIPEDRKLTIVIPADETKKFPPGLGYASLRVYDSDGRLKTFSNRIMVFVATKTPMFGSDEFEVDFNVRASLEPLKFFVGPNPDDFDEYRGYLEKVIDRASASKYGLAILLDAIDSDLGADDGVAATPVAVKAAYAAIIDKLTNDYYTAEQTDEAIDRVAAYYITRNAAGDAFETKAQLDSATVFYSGGKVRTPTRNDYCVVLADEMHGWSEYRYIYAVAEGQTTGSWQPQYPVEGVMTVEQTVTKNSANPVSGGGVWSAIWGTASTAFTSLYDWVVAQLAGKASKADATLTPRYADEWIVHPVYPEGYTSYTGPKFSHSIGWTIDYHGDSSRPPMAEIASEPLINALSLSFPSGTTATRQSTDHTLIGYALGSQTDKPLASEAEAETLRQGKQDALSAQQLANIEAVSDALAFDATHSYAAGDPVVYNGTLYTFTAAHTGAWTGGDVSAVDIIARLAGKLDKSGGTASDLLIELGSYNGIDYAVKLKLSTDGKRAFGLYQRSTGSSSYSSVGIVLFPAITGAITTIAHIAANPTAGNLAALDADGNPTDSLIPAANVATKGEIRYDRITITTGQLQDHAVQKVTLNAATTTLSLPALTDLTGKVSDFGIDMVNGYAPSGTPTAASFQLDGTLGADYNLIVPKGETWSDMTALAPNEMAVYYFTLSAFAINDKPTWEVMKKVVTLVPVPSAP